MKNVEFVRNQKRCGKVEYYFRLHENLGDYIRKNTSYKPDELAQYLNDHNLFRYVMEPADDIENLHDSFVETLESICNAGDDKFFIYHLLTIDGKPRSNKGIHHLLHDEYGLADINNTETEEKTDSLSLDLEWWIAHFFIALRCLAFEEFHNGHIAVDRDSVSELLNIIKNIDTIVVVDDARKIGPDDMKEIRRRIEK